MDSWFYICFLRHFLCIYSTASALLCSCVLALSVYYHTHYAFTFFSFFILALSLYRNIHVISLVISQGLLVGIFLFPYSFSATIYFLFSTSVLKGEPCSEVISSRSTITVDCYQKTLKLWHQLRLKTSLSEPSLASHCEQRNCLRCPFPSKRQDVLGLKYIWDIEKCSGVFLLLYDYICSSCWIQRFTHLCLCLFFVMKLMATLWRLPTKIV